MIKKMLKSLLTFYICYQLRISECNSRAAENVLRSQITKQALEKIDEKEAEILHEERRKKTEKSIMKTVENFKKLVNDKFYDGLIFHRIIKDFMIQTGDPLGTGIGGSDENIKGEFSENGIENNLSHTRGVLSMARRGGNPETEETMNSASSQFFIVHKDSIFLNGKYAAFGKVINGMSVVDDLAISQTDENDKPLSDKVITSIRFVSLLGE